MDESRPSNSWTELQRADEPFRRSSGAILKQTGPIGVAAANNYPPVEVAAPEGTRPRAAVVRLPSTPPPTDSKMGWESQQPARAPRTFTPAKVAMICAPLIVILGVAIWRLAVTSTTDAAPAVASTVAPRPAVPAATPVVTPIPEPSRVTQEPAAAPDTTLPKGPTGAARAVEPPAASARAHTTSSTTTSTSKKSTSVKVADASPATGPGASSPKLEPPTAAATPSPAPTTTPPITAAVAVAVPAPVAAAPAAVLPVPSPAPASPAAPQNVAPTALDANRISGEKDIIPDDLTQAEIGRSGVSTLVGSYKVCITTDGAINTVTALKATGFADYDAKIQNTIRSKWRYRPFMMNGKATAVCTAVRFIYSQK